MQWIKLTSLTATTLFTVLSVPSIAYANCDNSNNVNGWGNWCNVGEFLGNQSPTASGPQSQQPQNFSQNRNSFQADEFGGKTNANTEEDPYNWKGFALVEVANPNATKKTKKQYELAAVNIKSDQQNNVIEVVIGEGANQIVLDKGNFIVQKRGKNKGNLLASGFFKVASSDGKYKITVTKNKHSITRDSGSVNDFTSSGFVKKGKNNVASFVAGSPTASTIISARTEIKASYTGSGTYSISNSNGFKKVNNNITVNFSNSTWNGSWGNKNSKPFTAKASGNITGSTFSGTINKADFGGSKKFSNLQGSVSGQFIGDKGQGLIGQLNMSGDIRKNRRKTIAKTINGIFVNQER